MRYWTATNLSASSRTLREAVFRRMTSRGPLAPMERGKLNVLLVEDRQDDAALIRLVLEKGGYEITLTIAETEGAYLSGLATRPDIILSDYHLPAFSGERALQLANELAPDLPFILLSGSIGKDTCAELIKRGANDCVLKDCLTRLPAAVESAVAQRRLRNVN